MAFTMLSADLLAAARAIEPQIVQDRRRIHSHPELAYEEDQTSSLVRIRLEELGIPFRSGLAETGVVATITGDLGNGRCLLLRADMDALPIDERSGVTFASQISGRMHACGHDAHTAMLLGTARLLLDRRSDFAGTVKLMFQPAEEGAGGAPRMIEAGILADPPVDAAFALHVRPDVAVGKVSCSAGPQLAGADAFTITIRGRGGHAAEPHTTIDAVVVGAQVVLALQTLVAREVEPTSSAVLTLGSFSAGEGFNVIADTAVIKGTIRAFDNELFLHLEQRMREVATGVASALRATAQVDLLGRCPPLVNDALIAEHLRASARSLLGTDSVVSVKPEMWAEDFAFVLERIPGAMLWLGVKSADWPQPKAIHTPEFDLDESALPIGTSAIAGAALDYLMRAAR
jgi:amidohydrolase